MKPVKFFIPLFCFFLLRFFLAGPAGAQDHPLEGWKTDIEKRSIDLDELISGGPPKDGIPSIDQPVYTPAGEAASWLGDREPVISVQIGDVARAYPLQILMWHEIANTRIGDVPAAVTFCPLCYSALVFDRRVDGETLEFGVSGFLRNSDMIMYDRTTESLWQQITGEAVVGTYTGTRLKTLPSQIISFEQFRQIYPDGSVLSRETGHQRDYGRNPYVGYDDIDQSPMFIDPSDVDDRLRPMQKVVGVVIDDRQKVYPYELTRESGAINDEFAGQEIVVMHTGGAASAMDAQRIEQSKEAGSTGVFHRQVNDRTLHFSLKNGTIVDRETGSTWDISGQAVDGPLEGTRLEAVKSGDYFAFAWMVFYPESDIYGSNTD
ncbi:MAG: DUF3179 domain-containing protein [Cyclonatronaceae bacterium]